MHLSLIAGIDQLADQNKTGYGLDLFYSNELSNENNVNLSNFVIVSEKEQNFEFRLWKCCFSMVV